jgi:hypothetical protein
MKTESDENWTKLHNLEFRAVSLTLPNKQNLTWYIDGFAYLREGLPLRDSVNLYT